MGSYYGERTGNKSDAEYAAEKGIEEPSEDEFLKDDSVLVAGGTGATGQWITLGLLNQNFNVRVLTRSFDRAEKLFGPSGSNVDVFQGDVTDPATLVDAVDGAIGIVIAAAPEWWRLGNSTVEGSGAVALIEAAAAAKSVKRIVLLSATESSPRFGNKKLAEEALQKSGIPHVILRVPSLSSKQGGMSNIILKQEPSLDVETGMSLTRIDAAQVVCQALVHDRFVSEMQAADPDGGFDFGNCTVEVSNGDKPSIIDKRYWKRTFAALDTDPVSPSS